MRRLAVLTAALILAGCEAFPFVPSPAPFALDEARDDAIKCVGIDRDFAPAGPLPPLVRCEGQDGWVAAPPAWGAPQLEPRATVPGSAR